MSNGGKALSEGGDVSRPLVSDGSGLIPVGDSDGRSFE